MMCPCNSETMVYASITALLLAIEYWIGKNEKIKAGSMVELLAMVALAGFAWVFRKRDKNGNPKA